MKRTSSVTMAAAALGIAALLAGCSVASPQAISTGANFFDLPGDEGAAPTLPELTTLRSRSSERGTVLTIPGSLFEVDRADLKAGAQRDLVVIAAYLTNHTRQSVLIEGHTDSIGTQAHNHELSLLRGTAVEAFFLRKGVDPERIEVRGFGEDRPIASNGTTAGREQNRRVEIVMLDAGGDKTAQR